MYEFEVHKAEHIHQGTNVDNLFADAVKSLVPYSGSIGASLTVVLILVH